MTVQQLIEELEGMNPEAEVRFASQPNWPFEYSINRVVEVQPETERDIANDLLDEGMADSMEEALEMAEQKMLQSSPSETSVVYLEEGSQLGYLPQKVRNEIGW